MAIDVKIPTILRTYTGGNKSVSAEGTTLSELIDNLDVDHTGLKSRLITEQGALHRFVNVYVNDEDVRFTGSLDTALKDGDAVTILPAVAGGSVHSARDSTRSSVGLPAVAGGSVHSARDSTRSSVGLPAVAGGAVHSARDSTRSSVGLHAVAGG
jgi:sulfur-carrier protein